MQPDTSTTYLKQGQQLQREGLLSEAEATYRQAIELNPIFYGSFRYLGEVLALEGKLDQAVEAYQRAKELNPKALWVHQRLGEVFLQLNKIDDAIACFQTAIEINPDFSWAYNGLGECWSLKGNRENAIAAYQKAVELNPDSETFRHNLEKVLAEQELVSEEEITEKVEDSLELGKTLTEQGDFEGTLKYYRKACDLNPNSFDAHYQLIVCLSQYTESKLTVLESDPELGKVILQQLQEAHPDIDLSDLNDDAFMQALSEVSDQSFVRELYRAYLKREAEPGAAENWSHYIQNTSTRKGLITVFRNSPEFKNILSRYGQENVQKDIAIHWKLIKVSREHLLPEKIACYQRCLELNPYSYDLYYEYGQTLHRAGRTDEAILDYQQAIKIGCNLVGEDRIEEALKCYKKALEFLPAQTEIYYDLAIKLVSCGKINDLLCCYNEVFKLSKESFPVYQNLALFLAKQNLISEAATCFQYLFIIQSKLNDQPIYEKIWDGLNKTPLLSDSQIDYPIEIKKQDVQAYFKDHSSYQVMSLGTLTQDQKVYLKQMGLMINSLELMAQDDWVLERIYINSFSSLPQELLSSQLRLTPPSYQQTLVETGYVYTICPFSSQVLRSNQSFVINHQENPAKQRGHDLQGFCYRFLGKEVFYLMVGCPSGERLLVYFPRLELIICLNAGLVGFAQPIESINKLKSYMVSYWNCVKSYLCTERKQVANVIGLGFNLGHYIWQDLAGIDVMRESEILHKLDKILVGPGEYFSCKDVFPEIYDDKFIEIEDVNDVFQKVIENNYVALRVNGIFVKEQLIERIRQTALQKCSIDFLTNLKKIKQHDPVLCVQVRAGGRVWISQVMGIANIINQLFLDYPNLTVVFDGWSVTGKEDSLSSCWSTISMETEVMNQIVALINPNIPIHSVIGCTTFETSAWWIEVIDLHISPNGSGLTYGSWIANKPGVVHGPIGTYWTKPLYTESIYRENLLPQVFIPEQHIIDKGDGSYNCDWRVIYGEVIKILKVIESKQDDVVAYQKILEIQPDNLEVWLQLSKELIKLQRWEEGLASYRRWCELNPEAWENYQKLGDTLYQWTQIKLESFRSNPEAGKLLLEERLSENSVIDIVQLNDETFVQATGHLNEVDFVQEACRAYLRREPGLVNPSEGFPSYLREGSLTRLQLMNSFRGSEEFKNVSINYQDIEEKIACYWREMEISYESLMEAIACYYRIIDLNPYSYISYYCIGQIQEKLGNSTETLASYQKAIQVGVRVAEENRLEEALSCYQKALEIMPEKVKIYSGLVIVLVQQGRLNDVISGYCEALNLEYGTDYSYFKLGIFLTEVELFDEAIETYYKCLEIEPDWPEAIAKIEKVKRKYGKLKRDISREPFPDSELALTVLIPTYNRSARLSSSLENNLKTDRSDIEFLIMDNDSTDNTAEVVHSFIEKDKRIRYMKNPVNIGMSRNIFVGFMNAKAPLVMIVSDDDHITEGFVSLVIWVFQQHPSVGAVQNISHQSSCASLVSQNPRGGRLYSKGNDTRLDVSLWCGELAGSAFRREAIDYNAWKLDNSILFQLWFSSELGDRYDMYGLYSTTEYSLINTYAQLSSEDMLTKVEKGFANWECLSPEYFDFFLYLNQKSFLSSREGWNWYNNFVYVHILGWMSEGIFNQWYSQDYEATFVWLGRNLRHPYIRFSLLFWKTFVTTILSNPGVKSSDKTTIALLGCFMLMWRLIIRLIEFIEPGLADFYYVGTSQRKDTPALKHSKILREAPGITDIGYSALTVIRDLEYEIE
jgi:tetratricopeptide (TPR) repeat protein/glycosyltransferase involved in cell wall biosynthesis